MNAVMHCPIIKICDYARNTINALWKPCIGSKWYVTFPGVTKGAIDNISPRQYSDSGSVVKSQLFVFLREKDIYAKLVMI